LLVHLKLVFLALRGILQPNEWILVNAMIRWL
jgi:hypothetical protein